MNWGREYGERAVVAGLLLMHGSLLAWTASRTSPMLDEVAHLPAGLYVWQFGRFDLYRVNPPLVRSIAALPAAVFGPQSDWRGYRTGLGVRPEWDLAWGLFARTAGKMPADFSFSGAGRAFPSSYPGDGSCFRWARELYGCSSGILALRYTAPARTSLRGARRSAPTPLARQWALPGGTSSGDG